MKQTHYVELCLTQAELVAALQDRFSFLVDHQIYRQDIRISQLEMDPSADTAHVTFTWEEE